MQVRLWGTRGSIPRPGPDTLRFGGNTACVEVCTDAGTRFVLDCGTGAHELGRHLLAGGDACRRGHLLIGHTHWDHIQGFPFFAPLFDPDAEWDIYAPGAPEDGIRAALEAQMSYRYHPVPLRTLQARVRFHDLTEGAFEVDGVRIVTQFMNHPALTLGYRIEADGAALVYATDHEPHSLHPRDGAPGELPIHHEDRRHVRFLEGADLVIHDSQYVLEDFPARAGWGHCPMERVVDYALAAAARQLVLFHHDPERDDSALEAVETRARERATTAGPGLRVGVSAGREGECFFLRGPADRALSTLAPRCSALLDAEAPAAPPRVLVVEDDPDMAALLAATVRAEGVEAAVAPDGEKALALAAELLPALLVLDVQLPGQDGLSVCRALRAHPNPQLGDAPILILTGALLEERDVVEAFRAGATDYLTKPIKPTLLRSRVREWLQRARPGDRASSALRA